MLLFGLCAGDKKDDGLDLSMYLEADTPGKKKTKKSNKKKVSPQTVSTQASRKTDSSHSKKSLRIKKNGKQRAEFHDDDYIASEGSDMEEDEIESDNVQRDDTEVNVVVDKYTKMDKWLFDYRLVRNKVIREWLAKHSKYLLVRVDFENLSKDLLYDEPNACSTKEMCVFNTARLPHLFRNDLQHFYVLENGEYRNKDDSSMSESESCVVKDSVEEIIHDNDGAVEEDVNEDDKAPESGRKRKTIPANNKKTRNEKRSKSTPVNQRRSVRSRASA